MGGLTTPEVPDAGTQSGNLFSRFLHSEESGGGLGKVFNLAGLTALAGVVAFAGDQVVNDGQWTDKLIGDTRVGQEIGGINDSLQGFFGKAADIGGMAWDAGVQGVQSPLANPWIQGIASLSAFSIVGWGIMPALMARMPLLGSDMPGAGILRAVVGLACAGAAAYAAAVGVGLLRRDPEAPQPAAPDAESRQPVGPVDRPADAPYLGF